MKKPGFKCVLCKRRVLGWGSNQQYGNNPAPLAKRGQCCEECNKAVVSARIEMLTGKEDVKKWTPAESQ